MLLTPDLHHTWRDLEAWAKRAAAKKAPKSDRERVRATERTRPAPGTFGIHPWRTLP